MTVIGIISDTHGQLSEAAFAALFVAGALALAIVVAGAAFAFWLHAAWIGVAPLGRTL